MIQHDSGHVTELFAAYSLAERGYNVLWPLKTQIKYDLAIEKDGVIYKVQVKKATWSKAGAYQYLQARTSKGLKGRGFHYDETDVDYFLFTDRVSLWLAPYSDIKGMTSVCLGSSNPNYKPYTNYNPKEWLI